MGHSSELGLLFFSTIGNGRTSPVFLMVFFLPSVAIAAALQNNPFLPSAGGRIGLTAVERLKAKA